MIVSFEISCVSVNNLNHQHSMIVTASCVAISELARIAPLPLPDGSSTSWKLDLVKMLLDNMNNTKLSSKVSTSCHTTLHNLKICKFTHSKKTFRKDMCRNMKMGIKIGYCLSLNSKQVSRKIVDVFKKFNT